MLNRLKWPLAFVIASLTLVGCTQMPDDPPLLAITIPAMASAS